MENYGPAISQSSSVVLQCTRARCLKTEVHVARLACTSNPNLSAEGEEVLMGMINVCSARTRKKITMHPSLNKGEQTVISKYMLFTVISRLLKTIGC